MEGFSGERVLDICGGIDRNGKLLVKHFKKIDIIDLEPEFRTTPLEKQGTLIKGNLKDIRQLIPDTKYDYLFGSWALCYIEHVDVMKVLSHLHMILRPGGRMLLKEPIINDDE